MLPENPSTDAIWMVALAVPPWEEIVKPVDVDETETDSPPPLSETVCGELVALSVIVSVPVRVPATVGSNVTEIMQLAPVATLVPQFWLTEKSPETVMEVKANGAVPESVNVTTWAALVIPKGAGENVRLVGESVTPGVVGTTPTPLNAIACVEPLALSAMVIVPVRVPATVGVNVTDSVQVPPAATLVPQFWVSVKSPDAVIDDSVRAALPEFVRETSCAALVVPVVCDEKVRLVVERVAVGIAATPVPVKETACGDPVALSVIVSVPARLPFTVGAKAIEIVQLFPAVKLVPQVWVCE
jgi:hypothetical protein